MIKPSQLNSDSNKSAVWLTGKLVVLGQKQIGLLHTRKNQNSGEAVHHPLAAQRDIHCTPRLLRIAAANTGHVISCGCSHRKGAVESECVQRKDRAPRGQEVWYATPAHPMGHHHHIGGSGVPSDRPASNVQYNGVESVCSVSIQSNAGGVCTGCSYGDRGGWGCFSYPFLFYGIILVALRYAFLWLLKLLVKIAIVSIGFGHTAWCGVAWCGVHADARDTANQVPVDIINVILVFFDVAVNLAITAIDVILDVVNVVISVIKALDPHIHAHSVQLIHWIHIDLITVAEFKRVVGTLISTCAKYQSFGSIALFLTRLGLHEVHVPPLSCRPCCL